MGAVVALSVGVAARVVFSAPSRPTLTAVAAPPTAPPAGSGSPEMDLPDPGEYRAKQIAAHRAALETHARAPLDAEWSRETEKTLRDDLAPLATASRFAIERVDCKTTTCVAVLAFASYPDAQARWPSVLTHPNHAGCGTEVTLEDPADPARPYELAFVYQCPGRRASAALR